MNNSDLNLSPNRANVILNLLYKELESEENVDLVFLAGEDSVRLPAHLHLVMATTDSLCTGLTPRWKGSDPTAGSTKIAEISLRTTMPFSISVDAATAFVKLLYCRSFDSIYDDLSSLEKSSQENQSPVLQLLSLCDMYLKDDLLKAVDDEAAASLVTKESCVAIFHGCRYLPRFTILKEVAFTCFKKDLRKFLRETSFDWGEDCWKAVLELEGPEMMNFSELELFEELLKWREYAPNREEQFQKLIELIRFPIMHVDSIYGRVRESGVLSPDKLANLLCYVGTSGENGDIVHPGFPSTRRAPVTVTSSKELVAVLKNAMPGDLIKLMEGKYHGGFVVTVNRVTLVGKGKHTELINFESPKQSRAANIPSRPRHLAALSIEANDVKVSSMKVRLSNTPSSKQDATEKIGFCIQGSRNTVEWVSFNNCGISLMSGNYNRCENLEFVNGSVGIDVKVGDGPLCELFYKNRFANLQFGKVGTAIALHPGFYGSVVDNVSFANVNLGVSIMSDENNVSRVTSYYQPISYKGLVKIEGGSKNVVRDITIIENNVDDMNKAKKKKLAEKEGVFQFEIKHTIDWLACKNTLTNCGPGSVKIEGTDNILINVDAADLMTIGGVGNSLEMCKGLMLIDGGIGSVWKGCEFSTIK